MKNKNIRKVATNVFLYCIVLSIFLIPIVKTSQASEQSIVINTVTITDISVVPELNISFFGQYRVNTTVETDVGDIDNVAIFKEYINGEGGNISNYYANGTPISRTPVYVDMIYDSINDTYYRDAPPDKMYPEILFARHNDTWYNEPDDIPIWRNNYHLMYFKNPFLMTSNSTIFFEVNIDPNSVSPPNSNDLLIYLVERNHDNTYFEDEWTEKDGVEIISSFSHEDLPHHTHSENSSHYLVPMATNPDGTIGSKHLNVTDDFWIIMFSNANTVAKGWSLRGHDETVATNSNHWFTGSKSGWTTEHKTGVPDAHVHIVRKNGIVDGLRFTVKVNNTIGEDDIRTEDFYFQEIANYPPNPTLFISPINDTYAGDLNISWYPSLDPNLDDVFYTLELLNQDGSYNRTLVTNTSLTHYLFNTSTVEDGWYDLRVVITDGELYSDFVLSGEYGLFEVHNNIEVITMYDIILTILIGVLVFVAIHTVIKLILKSLVVSNEK